MSLTLAALLACVTPVGAGQTQNGHNLNGLSTNLLGANGMNMQGISATAVAQNPADPRITSGSALADLNGVAVEAVIISEAALR